MIGPIVRTVLRHKLGAALGVLEIAVGLAVTVHTYGLSAFYAGEAAGEKTATQSDILIVTSEFERGDFDARTWHEGIYEDDRAALGAIDGVVAVAEVNYAPLVLTPRVHVRGVAPGARMRTAFMLDDPGGAAKVLGLELAEGRMLEASDRERASDQEIPIVVTDHLAREAFGDKSAIGEELHASDSRRAMRVVGVVKGFRAVAALSPDAEDVVVVADRPMLGRSFRYLVRAEPGSRDRVSPLVHAALRERNRERAVDVRPLVEGAELMTRANRGARGTALAMATFIVLVVLAGRVGRSSFLVAERRRQIGIQRALGATRGDVIRWFLLEGAVTTIPGLIVGGLLTALLGLAARAVAPGIRVGDSLVTALITSAVLLVVGVGAMLAPALRAANVPPSEASRV